MNLSIALVVTYILAAPLGYFFFLSKLLMDQDDGVEEEISSTEYSIRAFLSLVFWPVQTFILFSLLFSKSQDDGTDT